MARSKNRIARLQAEPFCLPAADREPGVKAAIWASWPGGADVCICA